MQKPQETWIRSLGGEDPLEEEMATHCNDFCWENPMDRGAWWPAVHTVAKSWTWLSTQDTPMVQHHLLKNNHNKIISSSIYLGTFYENQLTIYVWIYFWTYYSDPLICMSILLLIPYYLDYFIASLSLNAVYFLHGTTNSADLMKHEQCELGVKFYLWQNEDYSPGDCLSDNSKKFLQRDRAEGQYICDFGKGESMQSTTYIFAEHYCWAFLVAQMVKNLPAIQETQVQFWVRRSPGEGNGNPLHYSCLENSMNRGTWRAIVHGVAKSQTQLLLLLIMRSNCHHEIF